MVYDVNTCMYTDAIFMHFNATHAIIQKKISDIILYYIKDFSVNIRMKC